MQFVRTSQRLQMHDARCASLRALSKAHRDSPWWPLLPQSSDLFPASSPLICLDTCPCKASLNGGGGGGGGGQQSGPTDRLVRVVVVDVSEISAMEVPLR